MGAVVADCFKVKRAVVVESDNGGDCVRGHDWWCDGYGLSGEAVIIGAEQSISNGRRRRNRKMWGVSVFIQLTDTAYSSQLDMAYRSPDISTKTYSSYLKSLLSFLLYLRILPEANLDV
ncbi:hypothetical protein Tco_0039220 [Tanacetum coccineum]